MISNHLTKSDAEFEKTIRRNVLDRLRVSWVPYRPKKGDVHGEIVASPQFPEPFGPHIYRALTLDSQVVIRPCDEGARENWLRCLESIPAWEGKIFERQRQHKEFLEVPYSRISLGRYILYEQVDSGVAIPIYQIAAIDGYAANLGEYLVPIFKSSMDRIKEFLDAQESSLKQATITDGEGNMYDINRTPKQQQWRNDTEAQIREVAGFEYRKKHSKYQNDPGPKAKGVMHPAGFIINDRRHSAKDAECQ